MLKRFPLLASAALCLAAVASFVIPASAADAWAPAASAPIHPGVQTFTAGAQCTGNFVFTDSAGNTYLGYAAHCAGTGSSTDTNWCQTDSVPLGTPVDLTNDGNLASEGTIVGHKTGNITKIHHDAAIVYGPRPYVLAVLVRGIEDQKVSGALIASISREVWNEVNR